MDYKIVFGIVAIIFSLSGYFFYFRDLSSGKTKPHAFSWLVWAVLTIITFSVQFIEHAGPGAWANGVSGISCLVVFFIALKKGEKNIVLWDWASLFVAAFSLILWYITSNPLATVILVTLIELCGGFFPTVRKSYHKPHEETAILYFTSGIAYALTLVAMKTYAVVTILYPLALVFMNFSFVLLLLWRRKIVD